MNSTKIKQAFTLIELLVWIAILSIIVLWASNMNFNRLNTKQELDIFTNNIKSNFEMIRNSSLSWKWIWTDLDLPEKWKIEYSTSNSWTIINHTTFDWDNWSPLDMAPIFKTGFSISKIRCLLLNWDEEYDIITWTWEIVFVWSNMTLWWDCNPDTAKILELTIKNKAEAETLLLNTLNWLVEIK
jgi:prepilin-type N-terminal cleavage/methylation domain-containing protein